MKKRFILSLLLILGLGFLSGKTTDISLIDWYPSLVKSPLNPPSFVFPLAWTLLYILIAIALGILMGKKTTLKPFYLQLLLNFLWSPVFFGMENPTLALAVVLFLAYMIFENILRYKKVSIIAATLLIPYFLWVLFAIYLNAYIVANNQFG
jgi:tryptophan-rich sensory protein